MCGHRQALDIAVVSRHPDQGTRPAHYGIANPPEAPIVWPVMNRARPDARKATSAEMSSGRASRPAPWAVGETLSILPSRLSFSALAWGGSGPPLFAAGGTAPG